MFSFSPLSGAAFASLGGKVATASGVGAGPVQAGAGLGGKIAQGNGTGADPVQIGAGRSVLVRASFGSGALAWPVFVGMGWRAGVARGAARSARQIGRGDDVSRSARRAVWRAQARGAVSGGAGCNAARLTGGPNSVDDEEQTA